MKTAYGGIVIDTEGRVLLREPSGRSSGVAWTFAKGKPRAKTAQAGERPGLSAWDEDFMEPDFIREARK